MTALPNGGLVVAARDPRAIASNQKITAKVTERNAEPQREEKVSQRTTRNVSPFVFFAFSLPLCAPTEILLGDGFAVDSGFKCDRPVAPDLALSG